MMHRVSILCVEYTLSARFYAAAHQMATFRETR